MHLEFEPFVNQIAVIIILAVKLSRLNSTFC